MVKKLNLVMMLKEKWQSIKAGNRKLSQLIFSILVITALLSAGTYYLVSASGVCAISVNGEQVAVVKTKAEAQQILNKVLHLEGAPAGQVAVTNDKVGFTIIRAQTDNVMPQVVAIKDLDQKLKTYVNGYAINVNGSTLCTLATKAQADQVLQMVENNYAKPTAQQSISSVKFAEQVTVQVQQAQPEQLSGVQQAAQTILNGDQHNLDYVIQPSDTLWTIARKNDMLIKDLVASNPKLNPQTLLQIGQHLDIVTVKPYVHVIVDGTGSMTETIPYSTIYRTETSLPAYATQTLKEGVAGSKNVTYSFETDNGSATKNVVLSEQVLQNPVARIVARGAEALTYLGSASRGSGGVNGLIWPLRGPITSPYGWRDNHTNFHTGIDIGVGVGTTYVAAADGVVSLAGWDGGYGKCIVIDHGNGVQTRYAHSSVLMVNVGEHVYKGQPIGLSGNTGNTTGPHLHFEVIINGLTVNPLDYI